MADMLFLMYWGTGPAYISGQAGKRYYQGSVEFLREFGVLTRHIRLPFGGFLDPTLRENRCVKVVERKLSQFAQLRAAKRLCCRASVMFSPASARLWRSSASLLHSRGHHWRECCRHSSTFPSSCAGRLRG